MSDFSCAKLDTRTRRVGGKIGFLIDRRYCIKQSVLWFLKTKDIRIFRPSCNFQTESTRELQSVWLQTMWSSQTQLRSSLCKQSANQKHGGTRTRSSSMPQVPLARKIKTNQNSSCVLFEHMICKKLGATQTSSYWSLLVIFGYLVCLGIIPAPAGMHPHPCIIPSGWIWHCDSKCKCSNHISATCLGLILLVNCRDTWDSCSASSVYDILVTIRLGPTRSK